MGIKDDAVEVRAQGWRTLAALHGLIEAELERSLQSHAQLSVVEYTVLDALSRQDGWHMRMQQLARATALSASATTRLVNRRRARSTTQRWSGPWPRHRTSPSWPPWWTPSPGCTPGSDRCEVAAWTHKNGRTKALPRI